MSQRAQDAGAARSARRLTRRRRVRGALRRVWAALMLVVIDLVLCALIAATVSAGAFALYRLGQRAASKSSAAAVVTRVSPRPSVTNAVSRYGLAPRGE